ncbi:hypothetical protein B0T10DRAFT_404645 [Thelonectria olida]|uniref:Uncharacterized protein n=1 Tax=Thelonectria olida TaxID=1576542 RepID=A0A9P8W464_9HYPO|nr:hypothetical protein B0T10DRAFT_404645 [Thelonectria olida]
MTSEPSPARKAQLQEVADGLLAIYQTLADLRFLDPAGIQPGPHNVSRELETLYDEYGLSPSIKYLYSILPYIDGEKAGQKDFFNGGQFTNFLDPEEVEQGRDPFYADPKGENFDDEEGPYMRPWVTPLSRMGNHDSVIIYDARDDRIWIIDQEGWDSTDPALRGVKDGRQKSPNEMAFDHIPSRRAGYVLRDIDNLYRNLEVLPGGGEETGLEWNPSDIDLVALYRKNGWPENFDGDGFQRDQARGYCAAIAKQIADEPLRVVDHCEKSLSAMVRHMGNLKQMKADYPTGIPKTEDELWKADYSIWSKDNERKYLVAERDRAREIAEKLCPGGACQRKEDLPLWEFVIVKNQFNYVRGELEGLLHPERDHSAHGKAHWEDRLRHTKQEEAIYRHAYEASKADADQVSVDEERKQEILERAARTKSRKETVEWQLRVKEQMIRVTEEWLAQVPERVVKTREEIAKTIEKSKKALERDRRNAEKVGIL